MKTIILALATFALAGLAQAQEYTVYRHPDTIEQHVDYNHCTVTTTTSITDYAYHGQTKQNVFTTVDMDRDASWDMGYMRYPAYHSTRNFSVLGDWIDNSPAPAPAFHFAPPPANTAAQSAVTVIAGRMTPEQVDALMNGKKQ